MDLKTGYCAHNCYPLPVDLARGVLSACSTVGRGRAHRRQVQDRIARFNIASQALADTLMPATESPHA
jgi:hypothetical protein